MGDTPAWRLAGEQFYGYIACTRPRERLILTYSRSAMDGAQLNPSRFISQVQRLFEDLQVEIFAPPASGSDVVHLCELAALGLQKGTGLSLPQTEEKLEMELAQRLYGSELHISVSSLEKFAACPYKFFLDQGLRLRERKEFLLDVREQGSFQHDVLARFHEELKQEGLQWRDITPEEAKTRVARIADEIIPTFGEGLLASTEQNKFTAENYKRTLQELMAVLVHWLKTTNSFDPEAVEFGFGKDSPVPAWKLTLENGLAVVLHGRVDRVDLYHVTDKEALCVVMDYKSGLKKPNRTLLHHGIQQQLPAYLLMLTRVPQVAAHFKLGKIAPAGCFLLPLKGKRAAQKSRRTALADAEALKRAGYVHEGICDVKHLKLLDAKAPKERSGQFNHRLANSGAPHGNTFNALKSEDFEAILNRSEELIRDTARKVYAGDITIWPYKHGTKTACERCDYQAVCRFDPWVQKYNVLQKPEKEGAKA